ncbi:multicopper oxidase domain-containing protein [Bombilactobacillus folatiphilus]|uniref:Multicopper oxidase domain-containing protein n=1 Tax=Bombilactobacillus folatiphilus TaxID=2923362 RepID=A0ABY4PA61_9LACO|nr:multicopper oxidase domain-containing protein [Bombilactobacillus folatiphilus]UQS82514.1 multicopper oxidase domain-containing protein [Bombilactobacillus folatiphilus]
MGQRAFYQQYFYDENVYDLHDGGYKKLAMPAVPEKALAMPSVLQPDRVQGHEAWYTIVAQTGETAILPGKLTQTWGYNASLLGQTLILEDGWHYHVHIENHLPETTTLHWHGLNIPGPITDGGPHAPIMPGEAREIEFTLHQEGAQTDWMHPHPCPNTARQVWQGLAAMVIVTDEHAKNLPIPQEYGVDDLPIILQDRTYHDNQLDYEADYDVDGTLGTVPLVNGTVNGVFKVTTAQLRLRLLNSANRREFRLHFDDGRRFTQIAGDCGFLEQAIDLDRLMLTVPERAEIVVDFSDCQPGDRVQLMSDDAVLCTFEMDEFTKKAQAIPDHLFDVPKWQVDPDSQLQTTVMSGMDDEVLLDGKRFDMTRIDRQQLFRQTVDWEVKNTNDACGGMIHPFHMHGCHFQIISRNGQVPYPNETGFKDTVGVNAGETVRIRVCFDVLGIFMYHCHILEHEDTGMMAQIEVYDPKHPKTYDLKPMHEM